MDTDSSKEVVDLLNEVLAKINAIGGTEIWLTEPKMARMARSELICSLNAAKFTYASITNQSYSTRVLSLHDLEVFQAAEKRFEVQRRVW